MPSSFSPQNQSRRGIQHWKAPLICRSVFGAGIRDEGETLRKKLRCDLIGEEEFDNRKTVVLELDSEIDQARSQISRIRMWIDEASWLPVQQKFFETSSDDYFLSHYTHVMKT